MVSTAPELQHTSQQGDPLIAICVATFQRPNGLTKLMASLAGLETGGFRPHLIVGDNDAEASGKDAFEAAAATLPFPATYVVEPTRGISSVRNRLIAEALAMNTDMIAFVDDDETVDPGWMQQLLAAMNRTNADVVGGPQINQFEDHISAYIRHCFTHGTHPPDKEMNRVSTGNVLYRAEMLRRIPGPFDVNLNLSGGADSLLAENIVQRGGKIRWCNEAVTYEHVPSGRATVRWILRRQFRVGASQSQITKLMNPGALNLGKNLVHGIAVTGAGVLRLVQAAITDRERMLQRVGMITFGIGEIAGVFTTKATLAQYRSIEGN